jgi:hypothetical protein
MELRASGALPPEPGSPLNFHLKSQLLPSLAKLGSFPHLCSLSFLLLTWA